MNEGQDKTITCMDCGEDFVFTAGEQDFYQKKKFSDPKRCAHCRRIKRERRDDR